MLSAPRVASFFSKGPDSNVFTFFFSVGATQLGHRQCVTAWVCSSKTPEIGGGLGIARGPLVCWPLSEYKILRIIPLKESLQSFLFFFIMALCHKSWVWFAVSGELLFPFLYYFELVYIVYISIYSYADVSL